MRLDIVHWPDPVLLRPAKALEGVDDETRDVVEQMARIMHGLRGVGLAAPQVGLGRRLMLVCPTGDPGDETVVVNPEILSREGAAEMEEGCLSFPGIHEEIERAERVKVKALDRHGQPFELEADGLLAIAIQHENDHLDGKLMIDHLSILRRRLVHRAMMKRQSTDAAAE